MKQRRKEVKSDRAPAPIGPYVQAVAHDGLVYASGQLPVDPASGALVQGDIEAQAERVFLNLAAVLEAAGSSLELALRVTLYLTDLADFPRVNAMYEQHLTGRPLPARSTVGVAALPLGAALEVDLIAALPSAPEAR